MRASSTSFDTPRIAAASARPSKENSSSETAVVLEPPFPSLNEQTQAGQVPKGRCSANSGRIAREADRRSLGSDEVLVAPSKSEDTVGRLTDRSERSRPA